MHKLLGIGLHAEIAERIAKMLCGAGHTAVGLAVSDDPGSDTEFVRLLRSDSWDGVMIGSGTTYVLQHDKSIAVATVAFHTPLLPSLCTRCCCAVLTNGEHRHWCERLINLVREAAPQAKIVFPNSPEDILPSISRVLG